MKIEHEGVVIELTQEQINSIERQKNKKSPEALFKELVLDRIDIHNPKIDFEKYPNNIFWFDKNGKYICECDWENRDFWFDYYAVWIVFYKQFGWEYQQTREFLNSQVEEHFKLRGVTTIWASAATSTPVEEHFKLKKEHAKKINENLH